MWLDFLYSTLNECAIRESNAYATIRSNYFTTHARLTNRVLGFPISVITLLKICTHSGWESEGGLLPLFLHWRKVVGASGLNTLTSRKFFICATIGCSLAPSWLLAEAPGQVWQAATLHTSLSLCAKGAGHETTSFDGKTLQDTLRLESFPSAGNYRSRMRTKFGNELMLPSRPSSSSIYPKSSIVDCRLKLPPIALGWALLNLAMPSIYATHSFVIKNKCSKHSAFHWFPLWRHEIKVPLDQIYCDASIAYLNEVLQCKPSARAPGCVHVLYTHALWI